MTSAIDRVVSLLVDAGYRRLRKSLEISSIKFDFSAALIGGERALDLVLVADTARESSERLRQKLESLSRALDIVESRRSVTAVLVGPGLSAPTLEQIGRIARVLVIEPTSDIDGDADVHDKLAVLLPLPLVDSLSGLADSLGDLSRHLGKANDDPIAKELVTAATKGSEAVVECLRTLVQGPLTQLDEEE